MTNDKKRVLMIDGPGAPTALQILAACYGAGLVRQGQIAGEYPPPPVDMPKTTEASRADAASEVSGTRTGRITRADPPFHELYGGNP